MDAVQAENEALQGLVVEVAANKDEARGKLDGLRTKYSKLLSKVRLNLLRQEGPPVNICDCEVVILTCQQCRALCLAEKGGIKNVLGEG